MGMLIKLLQLSWLACVKPPRILPCTQGHLTLVCRRPSNSWGTHECITQRGGLCTPEAVGDVLSVHIFSPAEGLWLSANLERRLGPQKG